MKKTRIAYTVNHRNTDVWISVVLALMALTGFFDRTLEGLHGWMLWIRGILPMLAALYYVWQLLVNGKERIYRLTLPFWVLLLGRVWIGWGVLPWYLALGLTLAALCAAWLIRAALTATLRARWLIALLALAVGAWLFWMEAPKVQNPTESAPAWLEALPELLLLAAYLPLCLALRRADDGKYHPTWGDRFDGRRVRSLDPISVVGTYVMPERNQANVFFNDKLEITALEKYIRAKRAQGFAQFSITEALLTAYVRTVAKYPGLNRFIAGERIYQRGDEVQFCMTVKKEMSTNSPETVIKLHIKTSDSIDEIYRKFHAAVDDAKKSMELDSSLDGTIALFGLIPGVLLKFVVWVLKLLDYFGLLPRFILEVSPFHGSIFFTSMGSLGIPAVYHHLYNFGNLPLFLAFGRKERVNEILDDGTVVSKKYVDYTYNVDERIVDGFYYASGIKFFHKLLLHPERLDDTDFEINEDVP